MLFPEENPQRFSLWWNRRFENYTFEALLGYYIKSSFTDGGTGEHKRHLLVGCGTPGEDRPCRVTKTTEHPVHRRQAQAKGSISHSLYNEITAMSKALTPPHTNCVIFRVVNVRHTLQT